MTKRILFVQLALLGAFAIIITLSFALDSWPLGKEKSLAHIESVLQENKPLFDELDAFLHAHPQIDLIRQDEPADFELKTEILRLKPKQTARILEIMRQCQLITAWYSSKGYIKYCMQSPTPSQYFDIIHFDLQKNVNDFLGYPDSRTTYTPLSISGYYLRQN